jgi:hypothetical integral membrane protein (TIGR02206 family)
METSPAQTAFVQFGPAHLTVIAILVIVSIALCSVVRHTKSRNITRAVCWGIVVVLLVNEGLSYIYSFTRLGTDYFLKYSLPLHACGMAVYLTSITLITKRQLPFEIAYFWGLGGTTQAILTPALTEGFPSVRFFNFFIAHGTIIVGVLVAVFGLKMRPRLKGLWITYALTWTLVFVVGGLNALLDANYMFVCSPPDGISPFYFLPWPWYLLFQGIFALIVFTILYLPFAKSSSLVNEEEDYLTTG